MSKDTKKFALGAIFAAIAGYLAGILTAPKSGEDTREDIKNTAIKAKRDAEKELKKLHSEINTHIDKAKNFGAKLQEEHKPEFEKAVSMAVTAKEKAREMLTALHEGDAEDKDLKKAIKEVNDAVDHLKAYLAKH